MDFFTYKLYSERVNEGNVSDVFIYDYLPERMKNQTYMLIERCLIDLYGSSINISPFGSKLGNSIFEVLHFRYGEFDLGLSGRYILGDILTVLNGWLFERVLDFLEVFFLTLSDINNCIPNRTEKIQEWVLKINQVFLENKFGYQIVDFKICRMDSIYTHAEIVKPSLAVLSSKNDYKIAEEEFKEALSLYMRADFDHAVIKANCAFESVLKVIAIARKWESQKDIQKLTARELVKLALDNELVSRNMQAQFENFNSLILSSLPSMRNACGAHGRGISESLTGVQTASLALHLAGSYILFFVNLHEV